MKIRSIRPVVSSIAVLSLALACTVKEAATDRNGAGGSDGSAGGGADSTTEGGSGGKGVASSSGGSAKGGASSTGGSSSTNPTVTLLDCGSRSTTTATEVSDDITTDSTWSGVVYVKRSLSVYNNTLTIEPGTHVILAADVSLDFGWNSNPTTILANGTEDDPIRFCGESAGAGYWSNIHFGPKVTSNSTIANVLLADGGGTSAALHLEAPVKIDNLQIRDSGSDGIWATDFAASSKNLTVDGAGSKAAVLLAPGAVTHFPMGGSFTGNTQNLAALRFDTISVDTTFKNVGIPYLQELDIDVPAAAVTFEAGVEYQFAADTLLDIGWNSGAATLSAVGTSSSPVVFRGRTESAGFFAGILIERNVRTASKLANVKIRNAGAAGRYALAVESPITLDTVELADNAKGLWVGKSGVKSDSKNVSVTRTESYPLSIDVEAIIALPQGGTFTGNTTDQVAVEGTDYSGSGTVPNLGIPYLIMNPVDLGDGSKMTVAAGTHFLMAADADLEVGWNSGAASLTAIGTATAPIRFEGATATAGFWPGLTIGPSVLSSTKLDYVEISHGRSACLILNSAVSVTNSKFSNCTGYGILKRTAITTDYTATNTFSAVPSGNVGTF